MYNFKNIFLQMKDFHNKMNYFGNELHLHFLMQNVFYDIERVLFWKAKNKLFTCVFNLFSLFLSKSLNYF